MLLSIWRGAPGPNKMQQATSSNPYRPPLTRRAATGPDGNARPGRCPHLGTEVDPGTSLAFPSDANHCYRTRLPVPISAIHQENYCLSARYTACPVYRQTLILPEPVYVPAAAIPVFAPEPEPVVEFAPAPPQRRGAFPLVVMALVLIGLLGIAWLAAGSDYLSLPGLGGNRAGQSDEVVTLSPTGQAAQVVPIATATVAPEGSSMGDEATVSPQNPTIAATATGAAATATPEPGATLSADCGAPNWWVLYVVESSDTIALLAAARGISEEELIQANCLPATSLTPGRSIYLPPVAVIAPLSATATPLQGTVTASLPTLAASPTFAPFPTLPLPTATFFFPTPVPVSSPTPLPTADRPTRTPGPQPTVAPPTATVPVGATATPPAPPTVPVTNTPPVLATSTPPVQPTATPPLPGGTLTPQPSPTATATQAPTSTPPTP